METNASVNWSAVQPLVTDAQYTTYLTVMFYGIRPVILIIGLFANLINTAAFHKMGLKDSVNISFFALSLSDLAFISTSAAASASVIAGLQLSPLERFTVWVNPLLINGVIFWYALIFYDSSMLLTAFIAVTRCSCVAMPLRFKNVFTKTRTLAAILAILLLSILLRLPVLFTQSLQVVYNPTTNRSYYDLVYTADRPLALAFNDIINRNLLAWTCTITIFISLVILAVHLRASSRFRRSMTSSVESSNEGQAPQVARELRLVKMVALVALIFVVLALPFMCYPLTRRLVPEFNQTARYQNLFNLMSILSGSAGYLNATLNAAIYYSVNSRYRGVVNSFFTPYRSIQHSN